MTDLKNNITTLNAFHPQALSGTTDITGAIIDAKGYGAVTFVLQTDAIAATDLDAQLLIQEGDDSGLSDAAAVADAFLIGTEAETAIAETDDKVTKRINPLSPHLRSLQRRPQAPHAKSKFLAASTALPLKST